MPKGNLFVKAILAQIFHELTPWRDCDLFRISDFRFQIEGCLIAI
jgi:hypothetical protein